MSNSTTKTKYTIVSNNQKSLLLGSIHYQIGIAKYDELKHNLTPELLAADQIFIECPLPHYTSLQFGYERAVLEILEEHKQTNKLKYFESYQFQQAMLRGSVWVGKNIKMLPWHSYKKLQKNPTLYIILSKIAARFCQIYNVIYNLCTGNAHTLAVQKRQKETQQILLNIIKNFQNNIATELDQFSSDLCLIPERNATMSNIIEHHYKENKNTIFIVGAGHLPGKNGIVQLLKNKGLNLE